VKLFTILSLLILILGCQPNRPIELHDDEIVTRHFNKSEITYLQSLLKFIDSEIRQFSTEGSLIKDKYHNFFEALKYQAEIDPYGELAKFDLNELGIILSDIPDSFLDEIWHQHSVSPESEVSLNHAGRFARFIQEAAKTNPFLNEYFDTLEYTDGISPSMYASVLMKPEEIELRLDRERLILAVHYITVMKIAY